MKGKLFALAAILGLTLLASGIPRAEATTYPSCLSCTGPTNTTCICPEGTDWAGSPSFCRTWNQVGGTGCWKS
jgi:hypothetical protein